MLTFPMRNVWLLLALFSSTSAAADALSDLRTVLAHYPAASPFAVTATVEVSGDSQGGGSSRFEVTSGPEGLLLRFPDSEMRIAAKEAKTKRDPNTRTPTRTAMAALTVFDVITPLDAAATLLSDLDGATLVAQSPSPWHGRSATQLTITSRAANKAKIDLRVWVDANGVPIAAERDVASNSRKERWEFSTAGDRLYATYAEQVDRASGNVTTSRTIRLVPKARR